MEASSFKSVGRGGSGAGSSTTPPMLPLTATAIFTWQMPITIASRNFHQMGSISINGEESSVGALRPPGRVLFRFLPGLQWTRPVGSLSSTAPTTGSSYCPRTGPSSANGNSICRPLFFHPAASPWVQMAESSPPTRPMTGFWCLKSGWSEGAIRSGLTKGYRVFPVEKHVMIYKLKGQTAYIAPIFNEHMGLHTPQARRPVSVFLR